MNGKELIELFDGLKGWHADVVNQFEDLMKEKQIVLQSEDASQEPKELSPDEMRGFRAGIIIAKLILGDFPIEMKVTQLTDGEQDDEE
jgi:hypothetical protein